MAIALVGTPTTKNQVSANTLVINYPAGIAAGHVAYCYIVGTASKTVTGGKTWTTLATSASESGFSSYLLRRVLDGTEGGSETFTITATFSMLAAQMRVYSGVNATPEDTASLNPQQAVGAGVTGSVAGFTTIQDGDELVFFCNTAGTQATSYTVPSGFGNEVKAFDATNHSSVGSWDKFQSAAAPIGTVSTTMSSSNWECVLVALQPAAAVAATGEPSVRIPPTLITQDWWAPAAQMRSTAVLFRAANPVPYDQQMHPVPAIQAGMRPWQAPQLKQHNVVFRAANPVPYDQQMHPVPAIQAGMQNWWAPVVYARASAASSFPAAQPVPYDQANAPFAAVQQGMAQWVAPLAQARATTASSFPAAKPVPYDQQMMPIPAVQAGMKPWQAPQLKQHNVVFKAANPVPYDQAMAPIPAVQTGMRPWLAPVVQAQSTTTSEGSTGQVEQPATQLPSAAIQKSWWAPVPALHPTTVPFSAANPPEYTTTQLPSAAIQQPWKAPLAGLALQVRAPNEAGGTRGFGQGSYSFPRPAIQPSWWAPVVNARGSVPGPQFWIITYGWQAIPIPAPVQAPGFEASGMPHPPQAVLEGNKPWQAPIVHTQYSIAPFHAPNPVPYQTSQLPLQAIQQAWQAPILRARTTPGPFRPAEVVPALISQLPLAAIQQGWWAPIVGARATSVLFHAANPIDFTTYKLPSAAVQQSWWAPIPELHQHNVVFRVAAQIPNDQPMMPIPAIQIGMAPWAAPIMAARSSPTNIDGPKPPGSIGAIVQWRRRGGY